MSVGVSGALGMRSSIGHVLIVWGIFQSNINGDN